MEKTSTETSAYACPGEAMHAPQLPVTASATMKTWKVMVAIDDSGESLYALKWAIDRLFRNHPAAAAANGDSPAMVTLVNVQPTFWPFIYPLGPDPSGAALTPMMVESVKKAQRHNATQILSKALQMCKDNKVKAETLVLEGDAKDRICEAADEMHVDLLVVGSRGLGKIKRAFLGSVSDYCAHHVHCPILIVKPPPTEPNL